MVIILLNSLTDNKPKFVVVVSGPHKLNYSNMVRSIYMITALCLSLVAASVCAAPVSSLYRTVSFQQPTLSQTRDGLICVMVDGCERDVQTAKPVLPVAGVSFDIPSGFEVASVTLTPSLIREIPLSAPIQWGLPPCQPDAPPPPAVAPDADIYGGTIPYPEITQPIWRTDPSDGTTLLSIQVFPVRFDPVRNVLLAAGAIAVTVNLQPVATPLRTTRNLKQFALPSDIQHSYLIISTSNGSTIALVYYIGISSNRICYGAKSALIIWVYRGGTIN